MYSLSMCTDVSYYLMFPRTPRLLWIRSKSYVLVPCFAQVAETIYSFSDILTHILCHICHLFATKSEKREFSGEKSHFLWESDAYKCNWIM